MVGGYLSLLYSISEKPLEYWSKRQSQTGCIRKILDSDLLENVFVTVVEIQDFQQTNIKKTSIACPADFCQLLDIKLPVLVIILKNLDIECNFQLQITDADNLRRYFQFYTAEREKALNVRNSVVSRVRVKLEPGWNKLELDLEALTRTAYKSQYISTQRLEICANCRLRRIYFIDKLYGDNEISSELCQGFFDLYMLKWGIHLVERATQTNKPQSKMSKSNDTKIPSNGFVTSNIDVDETSAVSENNDSIKEYENYLKRVNLQFLRNVQNKSAKLINDFFKKHATNLLCDVDIKHRIWVKPYTVPVLSTQRQKIKSAGRKISKGEENYFAFDLPALADFSKKVEQKLNCQLTGMCDTSVVHSDISERKINQDISYLRNMEEKWTYRYLCEGKQYSKETFPLESNTSMKQKLMSKYKPQFILPISLTKNNNTSVSYGKLKNTDNTKDVIKLQVVDEIERKKVQGQIYKYSTPERKSINVQNHEKKDADKGIVIDDCARKNNNLKIIKKSISESLPIGFHNR